MLLGQVLDLLYPHQKIQIIGRYWKSKITTPTDIDTFEEASIMHPNPKVYKMYTKNGVLIIELKMTPREVVYGVNYNE